MAYQKCPICDGTGIVNSGFYDHPRVYPYWTTDRAADNAAETCRTCQGQGILIDDIKAWQESVVKKDDE